MFKNPVIIAVCSAERTRVLLLIQELADPRYKAVWSSIGDNVWTGLWMFANFAEIMSFRKNKSTGRHLATQDLDSHFWKESYGLVVMDCVI